MVRIANNGMHIVSTDYWSTEHAAAGFAFLSVNAGAVRLLMPRGWTELDDPRVTRASVQLVGAQRVGVAHVVLEDGTDSPAYITIDARQCDRTLPAADAGKRMQLLVYGPGAGPEDVVLVRELPGRVDVARAEPK